MSRKSFLPSIISVNPVSWLNRVMKILYSTAIISNLYSMVELQKYSTLRVLVQLPTKLPVQLPTKTI